MIQPGDIYRTKAGLLLMPFEIKKNKPDLLNYKIWCTLYLNSKISGEIVYLEDYWLENQERLT